MSFQLVTNLQELAEIPRSDAIAEGNDIFFFFFLYFFRCPTSYELAQNTRLHRWLTRAILHITSLAAHTTLNTYNLWKLTLRDHLSTDVQAGLELGTLCSRERWLNH